MARRLGLIAARVWRRGVGYLGARPAPHGALCRRSGCGGDSDAAALFCTRRPPTTPSPSARPPVRPGVAPLRHRLSPRQTGWIRT
jgi:hypothetical protein